MSNMDPNELKQ